MCEVGNANKIDDESMIKHVINGVPDELCNKQMLFGATTMNQFKGKYFAYERFMIEFAPESNMNASTKKDGRSETRTGDERNGERAGSTKKDDRRCFLYGETGHIAPKCPTTEKINPKKGDGDECGWNGHNVQNDQSEQFDSFSVIGHRL